MGLDDAAEGVRDLKSANEQLLVMALREQEQAERARTSAAQIRALLESMSEGVTVFDAAGDVVTVNSCARSVLGLGEQPTLEEYRRLDLRRPSGGVIDFAHDLLGRLLRGETFTDEELLLLRPDGAIRNVLVSGSSVRDDDGNIVLVLEVIRDVTQLRELEQMREQYLSLITHDLRGPLTAARMAAELLLGPLPTPPRLQRLAARIVDNIARADGMVNDLLDAQRVRAGEPLLLKREDCDVGAIVRDVVAELVTVHGDRFVVNIRREVRGFFSPRDLRRALWNLLTNGVKHGAPDGAVTLTMRSDPEWIVIEVHNEGPPIPADELSKLFAPYARTRASNESGPHGWGLGLTLVRGCAEAHGGRVTVRSDAASGTTFVMELPRDQSKAASGA